MRDLGYIEGTNFSIEGRFADGKLALLPSLARELLGLHPDVLLVATTPAILAVKAATSTTPIVMVAVADPVGAGLVGSLARPGGNITGVTNIGAELAGKRLEILKEIAPGATRVAVLINPDDPVAPLQMRGAEAAAKNLAIALEPVLQIRRADDLKRAFEAIGGARPCRDSHDRLLGSRAASTNRGIGRPTPAAHYFPLPRSGGTWRPRILRHEPVDQYRQTAAYVHKILTGAKAADLPVEQASKFELAVNLKTAKALGLTDARNRCSPEPTG